MSYRVLVEVVVEHALDASEAQRMVEGPLARVLEFSSVDVFEVVEIDHDTGWPVGPKALVAA